MMKVLKKINLMYIFSLSAPIFAYLIYLNRHSGNRQLNILACFTLLYLILACLHHLKDKSLTLEVFLEYLLIAGLSLVVVHSYLIF